MADETVQLEATQPTVESAPADSTVTETSASNDDNSTKPEAANTESAETGDKKDEPAKVEATEATEATSAAEATGATEVTKTDEKNESTKDENSKSAAHKSSHRHSHKHQRDHRSNVKSDPSILPDTDDPVQIRSQVEYYFSDNNLGRDEFLWNSTGGTENRPVDLKKICSFQRMRRFKPYEAVVKALRDSHTLNITGEEGAEHVSRKKPYDPSTLKNVMASSVYVKGFGEEIPSTQFDVEAFFAKFDTVKSIKLRRANDGSFKGSAFAEFENEEQAKAFLALDPPPKWKGQDLKIMSKKAYVDEKSQLIKEGKIQPNESRAFFEGRNTGRGRGRGGWHNKNHNSDPNDWKARKAEDRRGGGRGGRGGRGRGRGGRGGRGGHGRRDRDEDGSEKPQKRSRDDEGATEDRPAKKVDTKAEGTVEAAA